MGESLDVVNRFYSLWKAGDIAAVDELFSDECAIVTPNGPMGKKEHRMMGEAFVAAFPDSHMVVEHTLEVDGEVYVEGQFRGTHTGDLMSPQGTIPATGMKIDLRYAEYFKVGSGQITHQRTYWDQVEMMQQLGLAPGS